MQTKTYGSKCSFTADNIVICRTFTDLPFAKEIAEILGVFDDPNYENNPAIKRTPWFEARYLLIDQLLGAQDVKQVLELAAGMSPRGMSMTNDSDINYIEMDLHEKIQIKKDLLDKLAQKGVVPQRPNLHLIEGDVTREEVFSEAKLLLRKEPVAILNEGLLRYLSFSDKEALAKRIHCLLKENGGVWMTPDIELLEEELATPAQRARYKEFRTRTGVDVRPNLFRNQQHALSFFSDLGFNVTQFSPLEVVDKLVSPDRVGIERVKVVEILRHRKIFVMTAK